MQIEHDRGDGPGVGLAAVLGDDGEAAGGAGDALARPGIDDHPACVDAGRRQGLARGKFDHAAPLGAGPHPHSPRVPVAPGAPGPHLATEFHEVRV